MQCYEIRYTEGGSAPSKTFLAKDDDDFYEQLENFLAQGSGRQLIPGSIVSWDATRRHVDDPPAVPVYDMATTHEQPSNAGFW